MRVAITDHHYSNFTGAMRVFEDAQVEVVCGRLASAAEAADLGRAADAVINQHVPITAEMFDAWPRCLGVVHFGKGVDNIDVPAATARGIWVANVLGANVDEVSNHVLGLLLGWARGIVELDARVRRGEWDYRLAQPRRRLAGQVLGLVGYGAIARALAAKAAALGLDVVAFARRPVADTNVRFASLDEVLAVADYLSLHVPLTTDTRHLIGERELARMKPTAFVINTSRGPVIDQRALVAALHAGRLAGAGLDVTDPEPAAADDPLLALPNVIVTPHAAWYSEESREYVTVEAAREAVRIVRGERPRSPVNPQTQPRTPAARRCHQ